MTAVIAVFPGVSAPNPRAGLVHPALPSSAPRPQGFEPAAAVRIPVAALGGCASSEINDDGCLLGIFAA